eukprot:TRINITY_DN7781_c0_g1_i2.p4 TRINITY_DN7781_c0_g1~~TRINITY_DN7781_c0_g1_i2.p4  ORF type:complete len:122 (-),score=3.16 TRINITY_DN7781_c0_g1_i2:571-936(-)
MQVMMKLMKVVGTGMVLMYIAAMSFVCSNSKFAGACGAVAMTGLSVPSRIRERRQGGETRGKYITVAMHAQTFERELAGVVIAASMRMVCLNVGFTPLATALSLVRMGKTAGAEFAFSPIL